MSTTPPSRILRLLWLAALAGFFGNWLFPVSNSLTRAGGLALFVVVWGGLVFLCWKWRILRIALLVVTALSIGFLGLPERAAVDIEGLRRRYITGLRRYEGVTYVWGG